MSNSEVGDYTPIPGAGPRGPVGSLGAPGQPGELPAANVREVPAAPEPEEVRYHYVYRQAPPMFHVYEETTGDRITSVPYPSEHQADEQCRIWNRRQTPPR